MRCLLLATVLVAAAAAPLRAQVPATMPPVDSGLVVRAWLDSGQLRGRLLMTMRATDDSVRYCRFPGPPCDEPGSRSQPAWLALEELRHLDVQVGNKARRGAVTGGILGGIVSFLLGSLASGFCEYDCPSDAEVLVTTLVVGGGTFAALGALIGSSLPRFERRF